MFKNFGISNERWIVLAAIPVLLVMLCFGVLYIACVGSCKLWNDWRQWRGPNQPRFFPEPVGAKGLKLTRLKETAMTAAAIVLVLLGCALALLAAICWCLFHIAKLALPRRWIV